MRNFVIGFGVAICLGIFISFWYVRMGFVDPRADIPINSLDKAVAMPSLDAAVDRRAPEIHNPINPDDTNLVAGMNVYQANCASCHGDIAHPHSKSAPLFYPRAPQFVEDAPDMPDNQNFYIIQHGIRFSGMPAWNQALTEAEMWQVTMFLSHMDKLTPPVSQAWEKAATSRVR